MSTNSPPANGTTIQPSNPTAVTNSTSNTNNNTVGGKVPHPPSANAKSVTTTTISAHHQQHQKILEKATTVQELLRLVLPTAGVETKQPHTARTHNTNSNFTVRQCYDKVEHEYQNRIAHLAAPHEGPRNHGNDHEIPETLRKAAAMALTTASHTNKEKDGALTERRRTSRRPSFDPKSKLGSGGLFEAREGYPLPPLPDAQYSPKKSRHRNSLNSKKSSTTNKEKVGEAIPAPPTTGEGVVEGGGNVPKLPPTSHSKVRVPASHNQAAKLYTKTM
eukprot:PhF_6_TR12954/c0_g1_i2/m.20446